MGEKLFDATYLGDGVYAYHDGFHVWLSTDRENGTHRIALEPKVFDALVAYRKMLARRREESGEPR